MCAGVLLLPQSFEEETSKKLKRMLTERFAYRHPLQLHTVPVLPKDELKKP